MTHPQRPLVVVEPLPTAGDVGTDDGFTIDEARVGPYELPDPLVFEAGGAVDAPGWPRRRSEIVELFEDHVFGRTPPTPVPCAVHATETGVGLDGLATRHQVRLVLGGSGHSVNIDVLLYLPANPDGPVPVFLVPNLEGNHTISEDPHIALSDGAARDRGPARLGRGAKAHRFPVARMIARGYGLATFYSGDAGADADDGFAHGPHQLFYEPGQNAPNECEWGTIGAWAWGCSRVLDHLASLPAVDANRVIVGGHSRLGKTALWAAAQDERFAGVFANNSGCTGAALSRRRFGENVAIINALFPHWFCRNYRSYAHNEPALPVDQHQLIALIAPRPVQVASASDDHWADPLGEFLAVKAASAVYELLGVAGLELQEMPAVGESAIGTVGYHLRKGGHELLDADWQHYLAFADEALGRDWG